MGANSLAEQVGAALRQRGWTISTAESCTGGLIAHLLTNIPGSSEYVQGGAVVYSNAIKETILGVPRAVLEQYGAVSEQTAREMVTRVRALFGTDIAVSVTGIAGPGGATADKPVGLTYIGVATAHHPTRIERYVWDQDREGNKRASADAALRLVLEMLDQP